MIRTDVLMGTRDSNLGVGTWGRIQFGHETPVLFCNGNVPDSLLETEESLPIK